MRRYYMSAGAIYCARSPGANGTGDDITLDIEGDFTVLPDGTIELPEGSTATTPDGEEVTGPAVIYPLFIPVVGTGCPFIWAAAGIRPLPIRSSIIQPF